MSAILQVQFLNCQLIVRPKILYLENGCLRKNLNLVASEKSRILGEVIIITSLKADYPACL